MDEYEQDQDQDQDQDQEQMYSCPTFSSYSSNNLAAIAVRVANEFSNGGSTSVRHERSNDSGEVDEILVEEEDDDDFEFSLERDPSDIFFDGQNNTVYPIFNLDRPQASQNQQSDNNDKSCNVIDFEIGIPLSRLLIEERERRDLMSASSSEDEEIANIPPGTYCVWKPKVKELSSPNMCNKSSSTGSMSKRWKFLDLLRRSNSEGNENYVFLTPKHRPEKHSEKTERPRASKTQTSDAVPKSAGKSKTRGTSTAASPSAHETFYVRNRAIKESDKRKSYLPQVLVGVFANVNALTRTYPPF